MTPEELALVKEAVQWINLTSALRDGKPIPAPEYWESVVQGVLASRFQAPIGWEIYRARLMPVEMELQTEPFPGENMGPPPSDQATAGRLNPLGTPCFYGALDRETAMAEVRPWRKARISVARFTSTSRLTLADLTGRFAGSESTERTKWVGFMLGRPVHRDDDESYLPSQRVAEACRAAGLKGILYDSSLKPDGVNVTLFADTDLECQGVELHEVTGVSFTNVRLSPFSSSQAGPQ